MKNDVLVSIITVSYNSEKTITKTIESVLNQTYKNIEYIIVDGNSKDSTCEIIKSYEEKFNGRLKYISESDNGIYDAMNKGIDMANGQLVGIINSDDYYEVDAVEKIVNSMTKDKYQILYGYLRVVDNDKIEKIVMNRHENINNEMIGHPTCFVTKNIYNDFFKFNLSYKSCSDYEFMLKISKEKNVVFIPVYSIISTFCRGGFSSNINSKIESIKMKEKLGLVNKKYVKKQILKLKIKQLLKF